MQTNNSASRATNAILRAFVLLTLIARFGSLWAADTSSKGEEKNTRTDVELVSDLKAGRHEAILALGRRGVKEVIPDLRKLATPGKLRMGTPAGDAQVALARLGEAQEREQIFSEFLGKDLEARYWAIAKLNYLNSKRAVRALGQALDDCRVHVVRDVEYQPICRSAASKLAEMVPNPPSLPKRVSNKTMMQRWRTWWKENEAKYPDDSNELVPR